MKQPRLRAAVRVFALVLVVLGVLAALVSGALALYAVPDRPIGGQDSPCQGRPVEGADVKVEARVDVANLDYPRVTSKLTVRVPVSWTGGSALFGASEDAAYRDALRCLLGVSPTETRPHEWRDRPPLVTVEGDDVVLVDTVRTDIFRPDQVAVGIVRVTAAPSGWTVVVPVPVAYQSADSTEVSITVPPGWLGAVRPWPPTVAAENQVMWRSTELPAAPTRAVEERSVELHPGPRAAVLTWGGTPAGNAIVWSSYWVNTLALVVVALFYLRTVANSAGTQRVVRPLLLVVLLPGILLCGNAVLEYVARRLSGGNWGWIAWVVDALVILVVSLLSWWWWLPRTAVLLALIGLGAAAGMVFRFSDGIPFTSTVWTDVITTALIEVGISYVCTVLMIAAAGNAARGLWSGTGDQRLPSALWISAALCAAVLVAERFWITWVNVTRHDWLSTESAFAGRYVVALRYHLWELAEDLSWILLILAPLAVWAVARSNQPAAAKRLGVGLFLLGPSSWQLWIWGFTLPVWVLGLVVLLGWMRFGSPVLDRQMPGSVETVREQADRSSEDQLPKGITLVDVMLATGPGGTPADNMARAVRLSVGIAVVLGIPSLWLWWRSGAPFVSDQSDSILLGYFNSILWEAAKWIFGAASAGLLWQHLPGKRGPVKVLPVIVAFAVLTTAQLAVSLLTGENANTLYLADAGFFTLGMVVLGLRMDRVTLRDHGPRTSDRWGDLITLYGLENAASRFTLLLAPAVAILSIWGFLQGGEPPSAPNIDPMQHLRRYP